MIIVRETAPDTFAGLSPSARIEGPDGVQHPWQIVDLWSDAELEALGIYRLPDIIVPEGKRLASYTFGRLDGSVVALPEFEDIPEPEPEVPQEISRRQFYQMLAIREIITEEAAIASNGGVIPQPLIDLVDLLPEGDQFNARMLLSGAATFFRHHDLTIKIGAAHGFDASDIDLFFIDAATLV